MVIFRSVAGQTGVSSGVRSVGLQVGVYQEISVLTNALQENVSDNMLGWQI